MAPSDSGFSRPANGSTGERLTGRRRRVGWLLAVPLLAPLPAAALFNDRVELFAAENITYDSNVFRLSKNIDTQAAIGTSHKDDWYSTTQLGATLDVPYSLQRFQANYTWFINRYQRFDQLNFNGHTGRAAWLWSITPELTGDLGYTDTETLANFANVGTTNKDLLRTKQGFADAVWFPVASWRLHAGAATVEQTHSDAVQRINDIETVTGVVGASYVTPRDDRLGVEGRFERGKSPHDDVLNLSGTINGYRQNSVGVVGHWIVTGHSTLDGRVDYVRREYDQPTTADFSGPTARFAYTWVPTGKLTVVGTIYRDIGPIADVQSANFVLAHGVSVRPVWALTDKVSIAANADYSVWDYRGNLLTGLNYTNNVRTLGTNVIWKVTQKILVTAGYTYEMRTSTLPRSDYIDNLVTVGARIGF
jgi:exopolysaccharide biosynthesis operon protein EpsL